MFRHVNLRWVYDTLTIANLEGATGDLSRSQSKFRLGYPVPNERVASRVIVAVYREGKLVRVRLTERGLFLARFPVVIFGGRALW